MDVNSEDWPEFHILPKTLGEFKYSMKKLSSDSSNCRLCKNDFHYLGFLLELLRCIILIIFLYFNFAILLVARN